MSMVVHPQYFNIGVAPSTNWSRQLEQSLLNSSEFSIEACSDRVTLRPKLPPHASLWEKTSHYFSPSLTLAPGALTRQTDFERFMTRKEDDLGDMPADQIVLVCKVKLDDEANSLLRSSPGLVLLTFGAFFVLSNLRLGPLFDWVLGALLILVPIVVGCVYCDAHVRQDSFVKRYRALLQDTLSARVATFIWC